MIIVNNGCYHARRPPSHACSTASDTQTKFYSTTQLSHNIAAYQRSNGCNIVGSAELMVRNPPFCFMHALRSMKIEPLSLKHVPNIDLERRLARPSFSRDLLSGHLSHGSPRLRLVHNRRPPRIPPHGPERKRQLQKAASGVQGGASWLFQGLQPVPSHGRYSPCHGQAQCASE